MELSIYYLESNDLLIHPAEFSDQNFITYKYKECKKLFSEYPDRVKIVVIGDSRPETAFIPLQVDAYFQNQTITYNFAIMGTAVRFQKYAIEKILIEKIKPDVIIWDFNIFDLIYYHDDDRFMKLFNIEPFNMKITSDLSIFKENFDIFLSKISKAYYYRENFLPISMRNKGPDWSNFYDRGYRSLYYLGFSFNDTIIHPVDHSHMKLEEEPINAFEKTVKLLKSHGTYLIIHGPYTNIKVIHSQLDPLIDLIPDDRFLDFNGNESLLPDELWNNDMHLDEAGAKIYTQFVSEKLEKMKIIS